MKKKLALLLAFVLAFAFAIPALATGQTSTIPSNNEECYDAHCNHEHDFLSIEDFIAILNDLDDSRRILTFEEYIASLHDPDFATQLQMGDLVSVPREITGNYVISFPSITIASESFATMHFDGFEDFMMTDDMVRVPVVSEPIVFHCPDEFMAYFGLIPIMPLSSYCDIQFCPGGTMWTSAERIECLMSTTSTFLCPPVFGRQICTWQRHVMTCEWDAYRIRLHCSSCGVFGSWIQFYSGCGRILVSSSGMCSFLC